MQGSIAVHMAHCYSGEHEGVCKYGDDDCPAKFLIDGDRQTPRQRAEKLFPTFGAIAKAVETEIVASRVDILAEVLKELEKQDEK